MTRHQETAIMSGRFRLLIGIMALLACFGTGCSSLQGERVTTIPPTEDQAAGVTYYLSKPTFAIHAKGLKDGKAVSTLYEIEIGTRADPDQRYEVRLNTGWFVSDEFKLELSSDGRLSSIGVTSTDTTAASIKALGELAASIISSGAFAREGQVKKAIEFAMNKKLIVQAEVVQLTQIASYLRAALPIPDTDDKFKQARAILKRIIPKILTMARRDAQRFHWAESKKASAKATLISSYGALDTLRQVAERINLYLAPYPAEASAQSRIAKVFKAIRKTLDKNLAAYVESPKDATKKKAFEDQLEVYKHAARIAIEADEKINGRALNDRRMELLNFLKQTIPRAPSRDFGVTYAELRKQLSTVDEALSAILSPKGTETKKQALASEIIRKIEDPLEMRVSQGGDLDIPLLVARALVEFDLKAAAVVYTPATDQNGGAQ